VYGGHAQTVTDDHWFKHVILVGYRHSSDDPAFPWTAHVTPLLQLPAVELLRQIAAGEVSAEALVRAHLDKIEQLNPSLNAFVELRADAALEEARQQDAAAARGVPRGPLGGLPVSVKSAIQVAGLKVETGSPSRRNLVADGDAAVVARLRAAGAIVLGTTNVADMLMGYESDNPLYGRTSSPWDLARTPGGSSGGEAAAIAAGCSAGGIGSDGGGSIRVPAHFTGIAGLKPTPGRIPATGHQPACYGPFALLGVVGPMARTVADLERLFAALAGWDEGDPLSAPVPVAARPDLRHAGLRVGFFEEDGRTPVTGETREAVRRAAAAAESAGYAVQPFRPDGLERALELWRMFFCELALLVLKEPLLGAEMELAILKEFVRCFARAPLTSLGLTRAWMERDELRASFLRQMASHRVLICPVASVPAFRHGERRWTIEGRTVGYLEAMSYTQWLNILGNPAVVVPVGRSAEGLPIGVQVVGRPWEEEVVLAVAAAIEQEAGGYRPPPETG
jgi:Asp-tRNA(Asn)/Glu-tRNA(Gln) amidotransferase A subunit family amidase